MLRRLLTILLTLALTLQGLAVPHAHAVAGESQPEGHDHRPHFHFGGCHGHHGHGHQEHCEGHRHSHRHEAAEDRSGSDETPVPSARVPSAPGSHSSSDHDDDAVYVSSDLAITGSSTTLLDLETSYAAVVWLSVETLPTSGHFFWGDAAARPPSFDGIPLYLSTLSLRL